MTKITKTFLVLGIASAVPGLVIDAGLVDVTNVEGLYFLLPFGVIMLGMFLISRILDIVTAADNRRQKNGQATDQRVVRDRPGAAKVEDVETAQPSLPENVEEVAEDVEEHELQHR
jgi:hypothetical protein